MVKSQNGSNFNFVTSVSKMPYMGQGSRNGSFFSDFSKKQCRKVEKLSEKWPNAIFKHFGQVFGIYDTVSQGNH